MNREHKVYTLCGMCGTRCPVEVTMAREKPRWICGNSHVPPGTPLCPRGAAGLAMHEDATRVTAPMIRTGERGSGMWREVAWEEALDHVSQNLRNIIATHGPRSVLFSERPGPHSALTRAFVRGLGTPNYCTHASTCLHNVSEACHSVTGRPSTAFLYDYANCKALVLQGRNIFESLAVSEVNAVLDGLEKGCALTVMDVRATVTASKAKRYWQVRPGTDYALNLAIIHILLRDGLHYGPALEQIDGLEDLRAFVQPCTPAWAAQHCGVAAEELVALARELAAAAPSVIWHPGWMTSRYTQSLMLSRSAYIINALLGSFGSAGGLVPAPPPHNAEGKGLYSLEKLFPQPKEERADGVGSALPHLGPTASLLPRALAAATSGTPYPVRAYLVWRHDPLTSLPDPASVIAHLEHIPLLVSFTDTWSDTAWHSDVVLPLAPYLENDLPLVCRSDFTPRIFLPKAAVTPRVQCRPDWQVVSDLAERLGLTSLHFTSAEDLWRVQLADLGFSLSDFAATGFVSLQEPPCSPPLLPLPTPSGRLEMRSHAWSAAHVESLRPYEDPRRPPEGAFRLITGRVAQHTQAHTQNNALLASQCPDAPAWIHSSRAAALNLKNGELVSLEQKSRPRLLVHVRISDDIHPEALFLLHGFGHALPMEQSAYGVGVADQCLMPGGLDVVDNCGMGPALQEHFVTLYKLSREQL